MKRGSSLKRKTRLRPRRPTKRRSARAHDESYLENVRNLECIAMVMGPRGGESSYIHRGPSHPHHMREAAKAGMGQKPSDYYCVPFCFDCHRSWHDASGRFRGLSREWREQYALSAVALTRARLNWEEPSDD